MNETEKAIEYFKEFIRFINEKEDAAFHINKQAVLTAISALEAQQTSNTEIKRLQDENESIRNWNACEEGEYKRLLESNRRRIELEAQKSDKWIPVPERLPEETGHYMITNQAGRIEYLWYKNADKKWYLFNSDIEHLHVAAWEPQPEPWKEEQSL